ncbi:MAG: class I SAM-dependent methyltransferase [Ignavibacteriae bacterium]|nr:class I SAM-dependent methyltransferase [Ignavibacteriota bacterium]
MKISTKQKWETLWQKRENVHDYYSNGDRVLRQLASVTDVRGKRVLEVGAGTGRDSIGLARQGADVFQLDYATNALKLMRQVAEENGVNVHIVGGDAFHLPFPNAIFDIIFHQGLLEHFRKPQATHLLKENIRILKPGGLLLVDVPQRYHLYTVMKHILIALNAWFAGWEREFSVGELEQKLRGLGLTLVRSYGEWMYPSLFYRLFREAMMKIGIKLPLYPKLFSPLTHLRRRIRDTLLQLRISLYTSISIGVIAQKP